MIEQLYAQSCFARSSLHPSSDDSDASGCSCEEVLERGEDFVYGLRQFEWGGLPVAADGGAQR